MSISFHDKQHACIFINSSHKAQVSLNAVVAFRPFLPIS